MTHKPLWPYWSPEEHDKTWPLAEHYEYMSSEALTEFTEVSASEIDAKVVRDTGTGRYNAVTIASLAATKRHVLELHHTLRGHVGPHRALAEIRPYYETLLAAMWEDLEKDVAVYEAQRGSLKGNG